MKILKKISKVIVIVMAVLATIWCGLYVYANYFYNDKQIDVENFYIAELPLTPSQFEEDFKLFIIPSQASEYGFIVSSL